MALRDSRNKPSITVVTDLHIGPPSISTWITVVIVAVNKHEGVFTNILKVCVYGLQTRKLRQEPFFQFWEKICK